MKARFLYFTLIVLVVLHLPFMGSDPDKQVDLHTRGAWTDEGLYASQLRNFVNYGDPGITENTTLIRGPVFDLIRLPFFLVFGGSIWLARSLTLAGVVLSLFLLARKKEHRLLALFVVVFGFLHFRLFHFSHYAMSEMLAVSAVIISFIFFNGYIRKGKQKHLFLASLMIAVAWGLKIQFLYLVALVPLATVFYHVRHLIRKTISRKDFWKETWLAGFYSVGLPVIYILIWYLPNRSFYNQVMFEQTTRRFDVWETLYNTLDFNFSGIITDPQNLVLLAGFVAAVVFLIGSMAKDGVKIKNPGVIIFGAAWLLLELHKLGMTYLPQRYLLSFYAATAFFSGAVLSQVFLQQKKITVWLSMLLVVAVGVHGFLVFQSFQHRTYELRAVNAYLSSYDWEGRTIAGVWAPAVSWETDAKTVPVWKGYNDPETFFGNCKPSLIIEEPNEGTSEAFYRENGFDLLQMSDSVRTFKLWRYDVNLYWLSGAP